MGKKVAEAEARAKQEAAAHDKRVALLEEELRDLRRCAFGLQQANLPA